jgi:hypothetical protein
MPPATHQTHNIFTQSSPRRHLRQEPLIAFAPTVLTLIPICLPLAFAPICSPLAFAPTVLTLVSTPICLPRTFRPDLFATGFRSDLLDADPDPPDAAPNPLDAD